MKKFRIGYFADGPWSHLAFEKLISDETVEFAFIVPRSDTQDDTLLKYAKKHQIDYLFPVRINSDEFYETARNYNCDLFVSMSFNQIFRKRIIELPEFKTINCHAGKLPYYRGRNILNWALINDEKEFGITVHYVDEGIDTGDIILQRTFPIDDSDTYNTLLEVAHKECAQILFDAIQEIKSATNMRIPQSLIDPVGFYCGRRGVGDEIIDWDQTSREIFNFIRALSRPGPIARTFLRGHEVTINKAREIDGAKAYKNTIGQILSKTDEGFLVKVKDSFIEILEFESVERLKVGDKFEL